MLPVQEKIVNFAKPASLQSTREEEVKGGNQCCTLQLTKLGHKAVATCCDWRCARSVTGSWRRASGSGPRRMGQREDMCSGRIGWGCYVF